MHLTTLRLTLREADPGDATALAAYQSDPQHRVALSIASLLIVAAVVFTVAYVYPINAVLFERAGGDHPAAEIASMVRRWIWADRIRFVVGIGAFIAILWAFRLPLPR